MYLLSVRLFFRCIRSSAAPMHNGKPNVKKMGGHAEVGGSRVLTAGWAAPMPSGKPTVKTMITITPIGTYTARCLVEPAMPQHERPFSRHQRPMNGSTLYAPLKVTRCTFYRACGMLPERLRTAREARVHD